MPDQTNWNGSVWGPTTKGAVVAELMRQGNRFEGKIVLFEPGLGQLQAMLSGEWLDQNKIVATLHQFTGNYNVPVTLPQTGQMSGVFDPSESVLRGDWKTDAKTNGKFLLVKIEAAQSNLISSHSSASANLQTGPPNNSSDFIAGVPPLITKTITLGSYRLDEPALRRLVSLVKSGTNVTTPAVNVSHKGSEHIHIGVDNLLADPSVPSVAYNVLITANEPAVKAGTNTVSVNLKKRDANILYVSGYNQIWVEGKASEIRQFLEEHESKATHFWRTYGSSLNSVIFLAMIAVLPSIPFLWKRLTVVAFVFLLLMLLMTSWRFAANTKIFLRESKFAWYEKNAGWLLILLEVALTGWVGYLVQRFIPAK